MKTSLKHQQEQHGVVNDAALCHGIPVSRQHGHGLAAGTPGLKTTVFTLTMWPYVCGWQDGDGCQATHCSTADYVVYGLSCAASGLAFLGTLIGAPVYLYLIRLPGLQCPP